MDSRLSSARQSRAGSPAGAGIEGWAGCGRWAGPGTAALGLTLALAWRAAAGEPCVGTSRGSPPASLEIGATGRLACLGPALHAVAVR